MPADGIYRIPLELHAEPEGGFTVTCPAVPCLLTEGGNVREALDNAKDALLAVLAEDVPSEHGLTLYLIDST